MFGLNSRDNINLKLDLPKDLSLRVQIEDDLAKKLDLLRENTVEEDCVKIFGSTATTILWGGYKILYTMMETEKVHPQYIEKCSMANEVWLPTDWCIEKFKESGLKSKIYKMPIGVDLENYSEGKKSITFGGKEKGFIFISVFGWSLRKGYDILLQAYYEEFDSKDDVTLVLCSKYAGKTDDTSKQVIKNEIRRIEQSVKKTNKPKPPLLVSDSIPEKLMGNLYNSAHSYICISRGEGFGMPYCEASMCGLPVIASNYSGQKDFLNYDNSFLVEPEGVSVNPGAEWVSFYYADMPMANFDRKSIDQTRAHMRYVYENYAVAKEKNKNLQNFIKENYGWDMCVDRMHDRLKEIYSQVKHKGEK
jgi:glycosyltransferase involved in cell wall biosynthesis